MIEGVLGFAVVLDAKFSAYTATTRHPGLMFERLSREAVKVADGPTNLLETMDLDFSFRKILTRESLCSLPQLAMTCCLFFAFYLYLVAYSWGVLVWENLYALNTLTKGSLADTLANRQWRLVLALMVRESHKVTCVYSLDSFELV